MKKFTIIPVDLDKYGIGRWNKLTNQYDQIGRTYPTQELAEIALKKMEEIEDEGNIE